MATLDITSTEDEELTTMFSTFILERPPLTLHEVVTDGALTWLRVVGAFAAVGILLWALVRLLSRGRRKIEKTGTWTAFVYCSLIAFVGYIGLALFWLPQLFELLQLWSENKPLKLDMDPQELQGKMDTTLLGLSIAGGLALLAVLLPFINNLFQMSFRRVWAISRLSFKEAVRRKVVYVFLALMLVILFANWFVPFKPEDQVRNYVSIVDRVMKPLLFLPAALLAAFAIPTDIKKQSIHTIVTKPVERFEIILGRIVGYMLLMTIMLFVMSTVSLFFILRGINPEARAESLTARQPIYGELRFEDQIGEGPNKKILPGKAVSVGREWGYRGYIEGSLPGGASRVHYAIWSLPNLPEELKERDTVRCEVTFDIYRTTKGREKKGVLAAFEFRTWQFKEGNREAYQQERQEAARTGKEVSASELAEKYGYFEIGGVVIADYHTTELDVPGGLFQSALEPGAGENPPLTVRARCETPAQFLGMSQYDFYIREDIPSETTNAWTFIWNFYKYSLGIWFRLLLFITICVALSARLGGVISFLAVTILFIFGGHREFIRDVAAGTNVGGGAVESIHRLVTRTKLAMPLEESTATKVIQTLDNIYRVSLQPFIHILPDVNRYDYSEQVANGFNIGVFDQDLLPSLLMLLTYILPWALLGFYMLKTREIAGAH